MTTSWLTIEQKIVNQPQLKEVKGVQVNVQLSSFDVPKLAKSSLDEKSGELDIAFEYSTNDEKTKELPTEVEGLELIVGKNTGRVFGMKLKCATLMNQNCNEVTLKLKLEQAEHYLADNPTPILKRGLRKSGT